MGGFYGSIHFRTSDHAGIKKLLTGIARHSKSRFYLAPTINGWTSAYPSDAGQDDRLSAAIAKRHPGEILHLQVHDDSVFAYIYYNDRKRLDEFNSCPDYFGDVSDEERQKLTGQPNRIAHLLKSPDLLPELQKLVRGKPAAVEYERLERFAALFDISNSLTSYEYIESGETDDIERFDEFIHVPDRSREMVHKKKLHSAIKRSRDELRTAGVLLLDVQSDLPGFTFPVWCPDPSGEGFLVSWTALNSTEPRPLVRCAPPWSATPTPLAIAAAGAQRLALSSSGRLLAVVNNYSATNGVRVYNTESSREVTHTAHARIALDATFSNDETLLASRGDEIIITHIPSGWRIATNGYRRGGTHIAFHPSGSHLVTEEQDRLLLIDPTTGASVKTLLAQGAVGPDTDFTKIDLQTLKTLNERFFQIHFSSDGQLLFCASSLGLSVYRWSDVLGSQQRMPKPLHFAPATSVKIDAQGLAMEMQYTYACAHDPAGNRVIFAGLEGSIRSLDLSSGAVTTLLDYPGRPPLQALAFSGDHKAVACTSSPNMLNPSAKGEAQRLVIFNYPALLARRNLSSPS